MSSHDVSARRDGWLIGALALGVRAAMVVWAAPRIPPTADGTYYHRLAQRIAEGAGYTWLWPDGTATFAAHYPVGYPGLVGAVYAVAGVHPGWAMGVNAVLGALAALAIHRALLPVSRKSAAVGAVLVALHPGLVSYTPALMTEGVVGALWAVAACAAARARSASGRFRWLLVAGLTMGVATFVRPQSILFAPLLGYAASLPAPGSGAPEQPGWRRQLTSVAIVLAMALLMVMPWTMRNCVRMDDCALVSVNGGWNLLIGTQPEGKGSWSEIQVPEACKAVFDEAKKDACFARAARARIAARPWEWLALAPQKLHVTFDYC
ncbi:MAG TPA: hypothetical protein VFX50_07815, partial [Gemmatimonadales bacterium]|nr:hypothetical protein [Gemmatimonadales bacterium]